MNAKLPIRALLVEDDDADAAIFSRYAQRLREQEVALVRVATAKEARRRVAREAFELVFVDLSLGAADGIDLLKGLQADDVQVPVVVVTGSHDEMKAVEAMKSGAYDYVVKSALSADLLERTIRNVRQRYALEQERARMILRLAELTVTDELTGLANRRRLDEKLQEEVQRSERTGHVFTLLLIDLDLFKQVNDRYGHQAGDDVLRHCAAALKQKVRVTDLVARYGGEEFCVLLPDTAPAGGRRVAETLRKAVKDLPEPVPTISVGVAHWEPDISADELVRRADQALYRAKGSGRDRVAAFGQEAEGGH